MRRMNVKLVNQLNLGELYQSNARRSSAASRRSLGILRIPYLAYIGKLGAA